MAEKRKRQAFEALKIPSFPLFVGTFVLTMMADNADFFAAVISLRYFSRHSWIMNGLAASLDQCHCHKKRENKMSSRSYRVAARVAVLLGYCCGMLVAPLCYADGAHQLSVASPVPTLGYAQIPQGDHGTLTIFYPSTSPEKIRNIGSLELSLADSGLVAPGNGHLIVISHGSGGSPWVHADLARVLIQHGFTVALPEHYQDNYLDHANPGPVSWRLRPKEVSNSIDLIAAAPRFAAHLNFSTVGIFGGSAGGHTALSFAGGRWSDEGFRAHCEQYIEQDFYSCAGFITQLHDSWVDQIKIWIARRVINYRFTNTALFDYSDPRIHAAIAMVPFAADFVPESLSSPRIPLGLVIAEQDHNQIPKFHVKKILAACSPRCEVVMDLGNASHGAMLSPMPRWEPGSLNELMLGDPLNFNRAAAIPELNNRITLFFEKHLLNQPASVANTETSPGKL